MDVQSLYQVGRWQRLLILVVFGGFLLNAAGAGLEASRLASTADQVSNAGVELLAAGIGLASTALGIVSIATAWMYLSGLGFGLAGRIFSIIGFLIPLLSLILLIVFVQKGTAALREGGCKVGLIGVSGAELARLKEAALNSAAPPPMPA